MGAFVDKTVDSWGQGRYFHRKQKAPGGRGALFLAFQALTIQMTPKAGVRAIRGSVARPEAISLHLSVLRVVVGTGGVFYGQPYGGLWGAYACVVIRARGVSSIKVQNCV